MEDQGECNVMESDSHMISHMTSHVMDLTRSGRFGIITYPEVDLSLIIRHLTYLTFSVNFLNQPSQSTYIESAAPLACGTSPPQTYVGRCIPTY